MEAKDGLLGTEPVRVVVRDRLSRGLRSSAQQWGFHGDTRIARQNGGPQDIPVQGEDDPDAIGLAERPKLPCPPDPMVRRMDGTKPGPCNRHAFHLGMCRQHGRFVSSSP